MKEKIKEIVKILSTIIFIGKTDLFSVDYKNIPGQCVYTQGGLKFRTDEDALRRYFAPILSYVSLKELIGEAVFWSMLPSALAIWVFPFLLYTQGVLFAVITTIVLYLIAEIGHIIFYLKPLNYIVFVLGNNLLSLVVYIIWVAILILSGSIVETVILGAWFLFFALGLNQIIFLFPLIPILAKLFSLPPSDQVLRNIGWYYAKKLGIDPSKWKMYERETSNGG